MVYIPKGEHDDPHELHQQQELEGSTEIEHTLYSHTYCIPPELNSFRKFEYIYQHFQDNEKIYESDPDLARYETDNTLYPYINNDIEYGLFEDVINNYYLDSQIKDDCGMYIPLSDDKYQMVRDSSKKCTGQHRCNSNPLLLHYHMLLLYCMQPFNFKCDQECYTDTQGNQQDQPLTPCTHAYDHITQHTNNLEDPMQQNTLSTQEEDASLFTSDTATPCDYNITKGVPNSDTILDNKSKIISPMGIHLQSKHKYRNVWRLEHTIS